MNMRYCNVCSKEYNASRTSHTCDPHDLKLIFLEEKVYGRGANLNADALRNIKQEIEANGKPADLVAMWEASAGRPYAG